MLLEPVARDSSMFLLAVFSGSQSRSPLQSIRRRDRRGEDETSTMTSGLNRPIFFVGLLLLHVTTNRLPLLATANY